MEILSFFSGVAFVYFKNGYLLGLLCILFYFRPKIALCGCFCLGAAWALLHGFIAASWHMPKRDVLVHAKLVGVIDTIPVITPQKTQFEFKIQSIDNHPARARVLLACYEQCPIVSAGQVWQLQAKLKKPQNLGNPGGFNAIRAHQARHIEWVGYTRRGTLQYLGESKALRHRLIKLRESLSSHLNHQVFHAETAAVLQALTLGLGSAIHQDTWALFRRTGTTHLMVISGAHIGLVSGLTYGLLRWIWVRCGVWPVRIPAQRIASIGALVIAFIYSVLAGFGVPAQRALVVCFFMLFRHIGYFSFSIWQAFRYALLSVLLFEPHAVLMPGFYLSFIAVAILITANERIAFKGMRKMLLMQLACLVGLMPLTLFLFSYGAMNGFFANLIAIPWVGFLIIPAGLLTVFLGTHDLMQHVAYWLDKSVMLLLDYLAWLDGVLQFNLDFPLHQTRGMIALGVAFVLGLVFPIKRFWPVILILFASSLYEQNDVKMQWGEAKIDVLDVGQGLSVAIQTAHHQMIYDTGVKFYRGGDMGQLAIIPYLKTLHTQQLDMVVVSHPDLDHRGGLPSLEKAYVIRELVVDDPAFYHRGVSCHTYPAWRWDGVRFEFLPLSLDTPKKNNHSCVLKITTDFGSVLLTGDIEQSAEQDLIARYQSKLAASFLLVPHHESNTSSSVEFLKAVSPKGAIAAYGFNNRYHFPHPKAAKRYVMQNIPVYSTEKCGLVRLLLARKHQGKMPICTKYNKQ